MLLRFRFSNFRSFRDEQELSLVASKLAGVTEGLHEIPTLGEHLLPVAAIYGANASGKTGVLQALQLMRQTVLWSQTRWQPDQPIPREPFAGDESSRVSPSSFATDLIIDSIRYEYGFEIDSQVVQREWLHAYPKGKRQTWFTRSIGEPMFFGNRMPGDNRVIEGLTRKNSLFLSAAAQNNHAALSSIYRWFSRQLHIHIEPPFTRGSRKTVKFCSREDYKQTIMRLMSTADLGICDLRVYEEKLPDEMKPVFAALKAAFPDSGSFAIPESRQDVQFLHRFGSNTVAFDKEQESAGTLAYLGLLGPIVEALNEGGVLCVDELDASLHPLMALQIIRLFNRPSEGRGAAQLIFNTHDTNLLSADALRRDQIWFTEKDPDGMSHLYPLTDFRPRKHENLGRGYLQGRYGAVPFLPGLSLESTDAENETA
jgi:hypothetical protein